MAYVPKPACCKQKHLTYLDNLRASGAVNMFGATPHLMNKFGLNNKDAKDILFYWMKTFGQEKR